MPSSTPTAHASLRSLLLALSPLVALGCTSDGGPLDGSAADSGAPCAPPYLVATDIDQTLTISDSEWLDQLVDPAYDPQLRPDADALMAAYAELGYRVLYITARGDAIELSDGRTARQATWDWLAEHGFPGTDDDLFLAEGIGAIGDDAVSYKSDILTGLQVEGWTTSWAYGNADTDIEAFLAAGVAADHVFLVGELAGTLDVEPIYDDQAYTGHMAEQMAQVDAVVCE